MQISFTYILSPTLYKSLMRLTLHSPAIEMVFVSPTVEEIIGCPMNTLTNDAGGFGAFIPVQITYLCQAIGFAHQRVFHVGSRSEYHLSSSYNVVGVTNFPLLKSTHKGAPDHTDHPTFYCFHLKRIHHPHTLRC